MIKFNMNNYVWFEPTELGLKVYKDSYKEYGIDTKLELVDGKACLQFHRFIEVYGQYITSYFYKEYEVFKNYEFFVDEDKLV